MLVHVPRSRFIAALAALSLTLCWDGSSRGASEEPPKVQLVETVPVETRLGNPALAQAAPTWVTVIRGATQTLDIEQFYLSDEPGKRLTPVLDAIVEAAKRGVVVRLMLDARMYKTYPMPADSLAKVPGITLRIIDMGRIAGGVQHAKFFIVDGRVVFLGSQNFDWRALEHIHEVGVLIRDERMAAMYRQVFDMDWGAAEIQAAHADSSQIIAWPAAPSSVRDLPIRLAQAPGDTVELWPSWSPRRFCPDTALWDRDAVVRLIDGAQHEIVVQVLQYGITDRGTADSTIDLALRRAAARGAQVRLIVSDWEAGRDGMQALEGLSVVPNVQVKMSRVPEWSGGYISFARVEHCKYMVVDTTWAWVGTANWEPSYFHKTRNIAATLRNRGIASDARKIFQASWEDTAARRVGPGVSLPAREHGEKTP